MRSVFPPLHLGPVESWLFEVREGNVVLFTSLKFYFFPTLKLANRNFHSEADRHLKKYFILVVRLEDVH